MDEKKHIDSETGQIPAYEGSEERKHDRVVEAGAILGDERAAEYGYVTRGVSSCLSPPSVPGRRRMLTARAPADSSRATSSSSRLVVPSARACSWVSVARSPRPARCRCCSATASRASPSTP